tara:strand:+ start:430 stop:687 length:258 start_codon:yes stop_codon:yes gene_type:complete
MTSNSYYKTINKINYDSKLIDKTIELVEGQGDGRISKNDLIELMKIVNDKNVITKVEYRTIFYIIKNYIFTDEAMEILLEDLSKK